MSFIITDIDKFKGQTTHKLNTSFNLRQDINGVNGYCNISMALEFTNVVVGTATVKAVRILITLTNNDWWFLRNGQLIFLADNNRIALSPSDHQEETGIEITDKVQGIKETVLYPVEISDFKKICSASNVSIQLSGNKWKEEVTLNKLLLKHFRAFYHELIEPSFSKEHSEIVKLHNAKKRVLRNTFIVYFSFILLFMLADRSISGGKWSQSESSFAQNGYSMGYSLFAGIIAGIPTALIYRFIANLIAKAKASR